MTDRFQNKSRQDGTQVDALEHLFAQGRTAQLQLDDDNFTKTVMNRLPVNPRRVSSRQYWPDIIGLLVGLLATYLVVDPARLQAVYLSLLPDSISISFVNMLIVSVVFSSFALMAWWSVEKNSQV